MKDKLEQSLTKFYEEIHVPEKELDQIIEKRLTEDRKVISMTNKNKRTSNILKGGVAAAVAVVLVFGVTVNVSEAAAETIYKIPVVGKVAEFITFRDYSFETETSKGNVTIPNVEMGEDNAVEDKINVMINDKVTALKKEQETLDADYKKAFLETGGKEEDYNKIEMTIDYEKFFANDKFVSFVINKYQTLAPAYNESTFYTLDLETGEPVKLQAVLGDDFATVVKEKVLAEMAKRMEGENPEVNYDVDDFKEMEINNDRKFYVNADKEVVVVFDKYEIAAGVYGQQQFVVGEFK